MLSNNKNPKHGKNGGKNNANHTNDPLINLLLTHPFLNSKKLCIINGQRTKVISAFFISQNSVVPYSYVIDSGFIKSSLSPCFFSGIGCAVYRYFKG